MPEVASPHSEPVGAERVGPYQVVGRIARGGMGDVLLARAPDGGEVALKLLRAGPGSSDSQEGKRFEREGRVLEGLRHPGIVPLLARGADGPSGRAWLALELVRGRDLESILVDRPTKRLAEDEVALIMARLASALAAAHAAGVVHRDVKPANVLCTPEGRVLLTDFGIALAEDVSVRLTRDELLGTPAYLAPEVLLGGPWEAVADVYALGALAWRALAGRPLFEGETPTDVLAERLTSETPKIAEAAPGTTPALCALIDRMLDKEPSRRPSALTVAAELASRVGAAPPESLAPLWRDAAPSAIAEAHTLIKRGRVLAPGDTFLHYDVQSELGRGANGVVYRAFHKGLNKPVALKVLVAGALASDQEQRRFLREAHASSALQHPCVVPVLDAGEHEGTFYLVLELVDGVPLTTWLGRAPRERRALLALFLRLCDGVQHAHTRGVIHRDLKPDNVLITDAKDGGQPAPHILDFGLAKRLDQDEEKGGDATREGNLLGTLRYMAPEQASGKIDEIDVRSDVYALGTILFELLTGTTPFRGATREVLSQILFREPDAPSARVKDVPWELDAICLKALEKDRDARYQSALDLKADLERYLHDQPVLARQASASYRARKWVARNRSKVVAGAGVAAVLGVVLVGLGLEASRNRRERERRVLDAAAAGWSLIEAGDPQAALDRFTAAREHIHPDDVLRLPSTAAALLPDDARAGLDAEERAAPRVTSARLSTWRAYARDRVDRAQVTHLLAEAESHRAADRLEDAARALDLARRLDPEAPGLRALSDALLGAHAAIAGRALDQARAVADDLPARRAHLERARGAADAARRVDAANATAQDLLAQVHAELGKQAELEQSRALRERGLAQAATLLEGAERALQEGDLEGARRGFELALAFDGSNERAQDGLVHVYQRTEERDRARAEQAKRERVAELRARAEEQLADARARFAAGELPGDVRDRYLGAMEALRQALFLIPGDPECAVELQRVAREFSVVLVDQGNPELAGFILRVGGVESADAGRVELPRDAHLAVVESERVNVRQAFGGVVNFLPTRAFDRLRSYVKSQTDRYRFVIEVRSEVVTGGAHPQVFATGLRLRMEDRVAGTVSPPVEVPLPKGRCLRPVLVSPQGSRLVRPFDEAQGIDAAAVVRQVEGLVQGMLQRAKR